MSDAEIVVVFDGSFDGFLTIVHKHYYESLSPFSIVSGDSFQQSLNAEYLYVETDFEKSAKVMNALKKIGEEATGNAYNSFHHADAGRYRKIYDYLLLVFKKKRMAEHYRHLDYVTDVHKMAFEVSHEAHMFTGFCRFAELDSHVYYSKVNPKNDVLPLLAEHFMDRMSEQFFVIHDTKRKTAAISDTVNCVITDVPDGMELNYSETEAAYRSMWKDFVKNIAVEGRVSKKRQNGMLPKRYRTYMTEFLDKPAEEKQPGEKMNIPAAVPPALELTDGN